MALIGGHTLYKIDDTVMIPIANEQARSKFSNPDETRLDIVVFIYPNLYEYKDGCFALKLKMVPF